MNSPCVLVLKNDWLMKRALTGFMQDAETDLQVCFSEANEVNELRAEIVRLNAGVVFVGETTSLASNGCISQLLTAQPNIKVIVVSEDSNWVHIFRKEDRLLGSLLELVQLIQEPAV